MRGLRARLALSLLLGAISCSCNFQEGDFVPTARKAQFHGQRTQWHDLLGQHCPKFGVDRLVAVPIPQPIGYKETDEYKLQFTFDGERFLTPWLHIIGRRAVQPPYVEVDLLRSGDRIKAVGAQVKQLPEEDRRRHSGLVAEFANATHWPKHLLVHYRWQVQHEVDADRGLTLLFAAGVVASVLLGLNVVRSYKKHLAQFIADVTGDAVGSGGSGAAAVPVGPKAE